MSTLEVTARKSFAPDVSFGVTAPFGSHNTPENQVKEVLAAWTRVTGLNWSAMRWTVENVEPEYLVVRVPNPVDNQADVVFSWKV